jgi:hypothetical protein
VIVGGGNAAGYAARTFVENGMADGRLCIVTKEVIQIDPLVFSSSVTLLVLLCLIVGFVVVIVRLTHLMRDRL